MVSVPNVPVHLPLKGKEKNLEEIEEVTISEESSKKHMSYDD